MGKRDQRARSAKLAVLGRRFAGVMLVAAFGALVTACSDGADDVTTTTQKAPSTTLSTAPVSTEVPSVTTTTGPVTSSTSPVEPSTPTTSSGPNGWKSAGTSLVELAALLAQRLPQGQSVDLPDHLPAGWSLSSPGQDYGDTVAGYLADITENPTVTTNDGVDQPFGEYRVVFTNGRELAVVMVVIGDWGETQFQDVTTYGKTIPVYEDENIVVALAPGWDFATVVGSPGAREAVLEMAASMKSW